MDEAGLIHGLQSGDPQAAAVLFRRYADKLVRLAEEHLSGRLAGRVDGEDVIQSVFRTFFRRGARAKGSARAKGPERRGRGKRRDKPAWGSGCKSRTRKV